MKASEKTKLLIEVAKFVCFGCAAKFPPRKYDGDDWAHAHADSGHTMTCDAARIMRYMESEGLLPEAGR